MPPPNAFQELPITEAKHVTAAVAVYAAKHSRFHDQFDSLTWRLSREPTIGTEFAPDQFIVISKKRPYPGYVRLSLIYTVEDEWIVIQDIRVEE